MLDQILASQICLVDTWMLTRASAMAQLGGRASDCQ